MFWGVALENGKKYSQVVETTYHVSMAALEPSTKEITNTNRTVSLMLEHSKTEFLLCTLEYNKVMQVPLDLNFAHGEEVTFYISGEGTIHLTGYIIEDEIDDEPSSSDDEPASAQPTSAQPFGQKSNKSSKDIKPALEVDDDDDDEQDDDWVPKAQENDSSNKKKRSNGETPVNTKRIKVEPESNKKSKLPKVLTPEKPKKPKSANTTIVDDALSDEEDGSIIGEESGSESEDNESGSDDSFDESGEDGSDWGSADEDDDDDNKAENGGWGKAWATKTKSGGALVKQGQPVTSRTFKQNVTPGKGQSQTPSKGQNQRSPKDPFKAKSPSVAPQGKKQVTSKR